MSEGRTLVTVLAVLHVLLVTTGLAVGLVGAFLLMMPAAMTVLIYDHPAATDVIWTNLIGVGLMTAPFVLGASAIVACLPILLSVFGVVRRASWLPILGMALTLLILAVPVLNLIAIIVGVIGLDAYCDGNFGCGG